MQNTFENPFDIYLVNLGKYHEGETVGTWVKFPATAEEMKAAFDRIGIGEQYPEWVITDFECRIPGLRECFGEYESIDKLNYLANCLEDLPEDGRKKLAALLDAAPPKAGEIDRVIDLTYNLNCFDLIEDICDEEALGHYYVGRSGISESIEYSQIFDYIDFERLGRDAAENERGVFSEDGYIMQNGEEWQEVYNGSRRSIPREYCISGYCEPPEQEGKLTVLAVEPGKEPYKKTIDAGLESLQHEVGGYIEVVYPFDDDIVLICNENGKLESLELNRAMRDKSGEIYDIIAGTFLVAATTEDSFGSLSPEQVRQYTEKFREPEIFANMDGQIVSIPISHQEYNEPLRTFDIYQLKDAPANAKMEFMNYQHLKNAHFSVDVGKYDHVYSGNLRQGENLESIYARFNLQHPADYRSRSLSVGDVVVLHEYGKEKPYFVDSYGFREVPDFFQVKEKLVDGSTEKLFVSGHVGTWHTIDEATVADKAYFLMEHDLYGDEAACIIVDDHGRLMLDDIYNGFDREAMETLEFENEPFSRLPDDSITLDDMYDYGYGCGMLPIREEVAKAALADGQCDVYRLYADNTDRIAPTAEIIEEHAGKGGIFGVYRSDWMVVLEKENYLKSAEMQMEDDYGMIDGIINNGPKEEPGPGRGEKSSIMEKLHGSKNGRASMHAALDEAKDGELEL